jgi:hypothetical protein
MRNFIVLLLAVSLCNFPAPGERDGFCMGHCRGKGYGGGRFFLPLLACECWDREDLEAIACPVSIPRWKGKKVEGE